MHRFFTFAPASFALAAAGLMLAGCGGSGGSDGGSSAKSDTSTSKPAASETAAEESKGPSVELVSTGFGQSDAYVQGIAIVTTKDEASIGEYATVSMNFLDASGAILGTEEQTETFTWVGQQLVMPVWLDLSDKAPKAKVAKVEASATISDYGSSASPMPELAPLQAKKISKGEYGGVTATFEFTNSGSEDLKDARIGVVCYDAPGGKGTIIGGTSTYPDLVAAGKTIRIDADVTASGVPKSCTAYPNYEIA